jgi:hypothetical protein
MKHESLRFQEMPTPGTLVAIDAEFVSMQQVCIIHLQPNFCSHIIRRKLSFDLTERIEFCGLLALVLLVFPCYGEMAQNKASPSSMITFIQVKSSLTT